MRWMLLVFLICWGANWHFSMGLGKVMSLDVPGCSCKRNFVLWSKWTQQFHASLLIHCLLMRCTVILNECLMCVCMNLCSIDLAFSSPGQQQRTSLAELPLLPHLRSPWLPGPMLPLVTTFLLGRLTSQVPLWPILRRPKVMMGCVAILSASSVRLMGWSFITWLGTTCMTFIPDAASSVKSAALRAKDELPEIDIAALPNSLTSATKKDRVKEMAILSTFCVGVVVILWRFGSLRQKQVRKYLRWFTFRWCDKAPVDMEVLPGRTQAEKQGINISRFGDSNIRAMFLEFSARHTFRSFSFETSCSRCHGSWSPSFETRSTWQKKNV